MNMNEKFPRLMKSLIVEEIIKIYFQYVKSIHKELFNEVYQWAGTVRKVNISKVGASFVR